MIRSSGQSSPHNTQIKTHKSDADDATAEYNEKARNEEEGEYVLCTT